MTQVLNFNHFTVRGVAKWAGLPLTDRTLLESLAQLALDAEVGLNRHHWAQHSLDRNTSVSAYVRFAVAYARLHHGQRPVRILGARSPEQHAFLVGMATLRIQEHSRREPAFADWNEALEVQLGTFIVAAESNALALYDLLHAGLTLA